MSKSVFVNDKNSLPDGAPQGLQLVKDTARDGAFEILQDLQSKSIDIC